jgi:prepilin peptidase CpaA
MILIPAFLLFCMLATIWFDATRYIIPNWLVGALLAVYPLAVVMAAQPVDWPMALAGMAIVFAVGYVVFAMKWMGGGDIKLIIACSLWVGFSNLLDFIFLFALLGGLLSVVVWSVRKLEPLLLTPARMATLPRILRNGEPVPYGLAIAAAFLLLMWMGRIPVL